MLRWFIKLEATWFEESFYSKGITGYLLGKKLNWKLEKLYYEDFRNSTRQIFTSENYHGGWREEGKRK